MAYLIDRQPFTAQPARAPGVHAHGYQPLDIFLWPTARRQCSLLPPSPLPGETAPQETPGEALYSTTQAITLTRAKLAALYSLDPATDENSDHTALAQEGFTLFADRLPNEHALYLGHDELFALSGEADITLSFTLGAGSPQASGLRLDIDWEYLSDSDSPDGWLPLEVIDDRTKKLTQGGQIVLRKSWRTPKRCVGGQTSYWLRGILRTPAASWERQRAAAHRHVQARLGFTKAGLKPEAAFTDAFQVDTANNFYPFGRQPARYTTFYIASQEAFQRRKALIKLIFDFSEVGAPGSGTTLALDWEYFDGNTWQSLASGFDLSDGTSNFTLDGSISFSGPLDWEKNKVNNQENYGLRVRIAQGDYGHPLQLSVSNDGTSSTVEADVSTLQPPVVASLLIQYTYQTEAELRIAMAFNDFVEDHTHACQWPPSLRPTTRWKTPRRVYFASTSSAFGLVNYLPRRAARGGEVSTPTFLGILSGR
jgi:hypothetical protein